MKIRYPLVLTATALFCACFLPARVQAEAAELRITKQPSVIYLPLVLMEEGKLVEKHAKAAGLTDFKTNWITLMGGGAATDALLSGNVDMVTSGVGNLLTLWDKTKGEVKAVSAASAVPMILFSRNPKVKMLKDFSDADKIAVPTIKVSTQATVLQMACEKEFGPENRTKLDSLTVAMAHPDAAVAVSNPAHELNAHFSAPPYQAAQSKNPLLHPVLVSADVIGGPMTNAVVFGTTKFHDANPKIVAAFIAALNEANAMIKDDPRGAAEIYLKATKEKFTVDELVEIMKTPATEYSATPFNTMKFADHMFKVGTLKTKPASWKDYFFPESYALPGS
jgi:NitT/TauT family transport system substrate-binding protein